MAPPGRHTESLRASCFHEYDLVPADFRPASPEVGCAASFHHDHPGGSLGQGSAESDAGDAVPLRQTVSVLGDRVPCRRDRPSRHPPRLPHRRTLSRRLGRKAKQEPKYRFYALYDRIYREDTLRAAWGFVRRNGEAHALTGSGSRTSLQAKTESKPCCSSFTTNCERTPTALSRCNASTFRKRT